MGTTRTCGRSMALALMLGGLTGATASGASACDGDYRIRAGDTLSAIAARCGTSVAALERANGVDPYSLQLGQILSIPRGEDEPVARDRSRTRPADEDAAEDAAGYVVRAGDTPASIAAALGISVETLMAANEDVDPTRLRIGQRLDVPDSEEVKAILAEREAERRRLEEWQEQYTDPRIRLSRGEWRLTVDVEADGLAPGEPVKVAVSGDGHEWVTLGEMPADDDGYMIARARIPGELAELETVHFAIERPWGDQLSAVYADGAGGSPLGRDGVEVTEDGEGAIEVAGKIVKGGGCALIVTQAGETYALAGGEGDALDPGTRVVVSGDAGGMAPGCVGHDVLEVRSVAMLTES